MTFSILVVGGAGYIGSHMTQMLLDAGHQVTVFDNLARGHRDAVGEADFIFGDLRSREDLSHCFQGRSYDLVMHFAALAYVAESVYKPEQYYDNNVLGSINLLKAMGQAEIHRLVFSSSCATYGHPQKLPIDEAHPQQPINPYGHSKLMVEQILRDLSTVGPLRAISLRYFNAAGCDPQGRLGERHDPETHLIPLVLREALRLRDGGDPQDTPLVVYGDDFDTPDGTCIRDYIHVSDLCSAHLLAAQRLMQGVVNHTEVYNLGNGNGYSVREIIDTCRELTGMDIRYQVQSRRPGDPAWLAGSADAAQQQLGWTPKTPELREIIRTAWDWQCATSAASSLSDTGE